MKTLLVIAAAMVGLSSSVALADCAAHRVTAAKDVDKEMTTASIAKTSRASQTAATEKEQVPAGDKQDATQQ